MLARTPGCSALTHQCCNNYNPVWKSDGVLAPHTLLTKPRQVDVRWHYCRECRCAAASGKQSRSEHFGPAANAATTFAAEATAATESQPRALRLHGHSEPRTQRAADCRRQAIRTQKSACNQKRTTHNKRQTLASGRHYGRNEATVQT